jgi:hypothetical protein
MHEEVQVERMVAGSPYFFDLVSRGLRRQGRATERAKRAGVGDRSYQRGAAKAAHRRLDNWVRDAEQIEEIGAGPHVVLPGLSDHGNAIIEPAACHLLLSGLPVICPTADFPKCMSSPNSKNNSLYQK